MLRMVLSCLLLSVFLPVQAFSELGSDEKCNKIFGRDARSSYDVEVVKLSALFLSEIGKTATPVVCSGSIDPYTTVASKLVPDGFQTYFLILFDANLRLSVGEEIRGMVAHEVAHIVTDGENACGRMTSKDAFIDCEHRADKEGNRLAGRGQMARSLTSTLDYLSRTRGEGDLFALQVMTDLRRRIFLLR